MHFHEHHPLQCGQRAHLETPRWATRAMTHFLSTCQWGALRTACWSGVRKLQGVPARKGKVVDVLELGHAHGQRPEDPPLGGRGSTGSFVVHCNETRRRPPSHGVIERGVVRERPHARRGRCRKVTVGRGNARLARHRCWTCVYLFFAKLIHQLASFVEVWEPSAASVLDAQAH